MHEHAKQLRWIRSFAFSVPFLSPARVGLRRAISIYCTRSEKTPPVKSGDKNSPIGGCEQSLQVMSALMTSVLADSRRQLDELARTAITSERFRIRSTTARIFVSGGSMIWT